VIPAQIFVTCHSESRGGYGPVGGEGTDLSRRGGLWTPPVEYGPVPQGGIRTCPAGGGTDLSCRREGTDLSSQGTVETGGP